MVGTLGGFLNSLLCASGAQLGSEDKALKLDRQTTRESENKMSQAPNIIININKMLALIMATVVGLESMTILVTMVMEVAGRGRWMISNDIDNSYNVINIILEIIHDI